jgi:hypothetical protein
VPPRRSKKGADHVHALLGVDDLQVEYHRLGTLLCSRAHEIDHVHNARHVHAGQRGGVQILNALVDPHM